MEKKINQPAGNFVKRSLVVAAGISNYSPKDMFMVGPIYSLQVIKLPKSG